MLSLTIFKSKFDNKTSNKITLDDNKFEKLFYGLSKIPKKGKTNAELISPAVYYPGTTRANKNVIAWAGWTAVDIDDLDLNGRDLVNVVNDLIPTWGYICYSTASSTINQAKFRLVFRLTKDIQCDDIRHFWYALQTELGNIGDRQCKDLSRMYYVPATYDDAHNFIFSGGDEPLCVSALLAKYPYAVKERSENFLDRLPEEWAKQVIEHRKTSLTNDTYHWTGYKDCPFVNKKLLQEYMSIAGIDGSGRYRMIYKMMISIASSAIEKGYPITEIEIVELIRQIDMDSSNKYQNRALDVEASNALEYAYKHGAFNVT